MSEASRHEIVAGRLALCCAFFVSVVWGTTFLVSKDVLDAGVSPETLTMARFVVAYVVVGIISWAHARRCPSAVPRSAGWGADVRSEILFVLLGITGGSGYFLLEYSALRHTSATDVSLITSAVPLITTALMIVWRKQKMLPGMLVGTLVATLGVVLVICGGAEDAGQSTLLGNMLAVGDLIAWTAYTLLLVELSDRYSSVYVARRLFIWAFATLMPLWLCGGGVYEVGLLSNSGTLLRVLYLGLVASGVCVWIWGYSTAQIGAVRTSNFLLLMPVVSLAASALMRPDELTIWNLAGAVLVISGIALSEKNSLPTNDDKSSEGGK